MLIMTMLFNAHGQVYVFWKSCFSMPVMHALVKKINDFMCMPKKNKFASKNPRPKSFGLHNIFERNFPKSGYILDQHW
jgi:hypothetical protein